MCLSLLPVILRAKLGIELISKGVEIGDAGIEKGVSFQ
jgi:hypothetical protein